VVGASTVAVEAPKYFGILVHRGQVHYMNNLIPSQLVWVFVTDPCVTPTSQFTFQLKLATNEYFQ